MQKQTVGAAIEVNYKVKFKKPKKKIPAILQSSDQLFFISRQFIGITRHIGLIRAERNFKILWAVVNYTAEPVTVKVGDFAAIGGDTSATEPVEFVDSCSKEVRPRDVGTIRGKVKRDAVATRYNYKVYINGKLALDPELDIDPPGTILPG